MAIPDLEVEDVADRYDGELLAEFREAYVKTQIRDAADFAATRWRAKIDARLASGDLTDNLYRRTIADAVLRVLRNPGGLASEGEGGYNYSTRASVASGNLWFTDQDIETLCGPEQAFVPGTAQIGVRGRRW